MINPLTQDELEVLEADSPTLAGVLRGQQNEIQRLAGTVGQLKEEQEAKLAEEQAAVKAEIQAAIDANATLAAWQTAQDRAMWNEASKLDKVLRESPKYADVPFADRFAKVVELTQSALEVEASVPAASRKVAKASTKQSEDLELDLEQLSAAEIGALMGKKSPEELHALISGKDATAAAGLDDLSTRDIARQFAGKSREEIEAHIESLIR